MKRKLTNQGWAFVWGCIAVFAYALPIIICGIIERDRFFKDKGTAVSFLGILAIVCFVVFAKKLVKKICKATTPLGFGSLILLVVSIGLRTLADDLLLIAIISLIASMVAWFPFQIASVYSENSKDTNGDVLKTEGMAFKVAVGKIFQLSFVVKEE